MSDGLARVRLGGSYIPPCMYFGARVRGWVVRMYLRAWVRTSFLVWMTLGVYDALKGGGV